MFRWCCKYERKHVFVCTDPCIYDGVCPCVFMFVRSLTPGRPPLLGLHGQRTHHSPHLHSRRGGGTSVHWSLCQCGTCFQGWEVRTRSLAFSLYSSSIRSQQNPYSYHSLFHAFSRHLTLLFLPPLSPSTPPFPLPLSLSFFSLGGDLSLPLSSTTQEAGWRNIWFSLKLLIR